MAVGISTSEERLKELEEAPGDPIGVCQCLKGGAERTGPRGNGHKVVHRRFCLNITKRFVNMGVPEPWPRLPGEADLPVSLGKVLCVAHILYGTWQVQSTDP